MKAHPSVCDKQHCLALIFAYEVTNVEGSHNVISEHLVSLPCYNSLHLLLSCLPCMLSSATQKCASVHTLPSAEGHNTARKTSMVSLHAQPALQRKPLGSSWMQCSVAFSFSAVGARNLLTLQPPSPFVSYSLLMR